jgi:4-hydroxy-tetrahydrodipicolinate reductase
MKIALIGYGKMGHAIEEIAKEKGIEVARIVDPHNGIDIRELKKGDVDVAIEFTAPEVAFDNIMYCLQNQIPVVSGSTGWLHKLPEVKLAIKENKGHFFYASNYSLGVNLFFQLNKQLAALMEKYDVYTPEMEEIHHTEKLDAPSGTAITLAEGLLANYAKLDKWHLVGETDQTDRSLPIKAMREPDVPGTHTVKFISDFDKIEITHTAHTRRGFASGAVIASEWIINQPSGFFGMEDLLKKD